MTLSTSYWGFCKPVTDQLNCKQWQTWLPFPMAHICRSLARRGFAQIFFPGTARDVTEAKPKKPHRCLPTREGSLPGHRTVTVLVRLGLLGAEAMARLLGGGSSAHPLFSAITQVRFFGRRMSTSLAGDGLAAHAGVGAAAQPAGRLPASRAAQGLHREGHRLPPPFQ